MSAAVSQADQGERMGAIGEISATVVSPGMIEEGSAAPESPPRELWWPTSQINRALHHVFGGKPSTLLP
jgi:hypothetical protein